MKRIAALAGATSVLMALSACGNDPRVQQTGQTFRNLAGAVFSRGNQESGPIMPSAEDVGRALAANDLPLSIVVNSASENGALLTQIEQNGAYDTFATGARQTLTFKKGLVAATRGLGNDLMSADIDASVALVTSRKSGQTQRKMRYLDGEDETFEYTFDCTISRGSSEVLDTGLQKSTVVNMTESCTAATREFTNTYKVARDGSIVLSEQWLSPIQGKSQITQIRR